MLARQQPHALQLQSQANFPLRSLPLNLQVLGTKLNRSLIPKNAQPTNYRLSFITQIAMMSKCFPLMHIADMHFHKRNVHARKRVSNRYTGMCKRAWVNNDSFGAVEARFVDSVDNCAFPVGLEVGEGCRVGCALGLRRRGYVGEGGGAVDCWFTCSWVDVFSICLLKGTWSKIPSRFKLGPLIMRIDFAMFGIRLFDMRT
jgi:hypothetical protein